MKRNIFLTFAALFVLLFSSCSKDIDLPGTKWKATFAKAVNYEGMDMQLNLAFDLKFIDATQSSFSMSGTVTAMGETQQYPSETDEGTYTFDGEKGMLDGEQPFTYNKSDKTITIETAVEPDEVDIYGSNTITLVFKDV